MESVSTFYIDDSGTRHPDKRAASTPQHGNDWFALGGVIIEDCHQVVARQQIAEFRLKWPQIANEPLHSSDIRGRTKQFDWLGKDSKLRQEFLSDLQAMLLNLPVVGLACVIDRPGYNRRYGPKYGPDRWLLCKTAFAVAVERATKFARARGTRLRVYVERSCENDHAVLKAYYSDLRNKGIWFDPETSRKYVPATANDFRDTLYEFKIKNKSSPLMQIADLFLWPMCMGGYDKNNHPYMQLMKAGKLIDCCLRPDEIEAQGIKYSCFDKGV